MKCRKHLGYQIPCIQCSKDEYDLALADNIRLESEGLPPKHDLKDLTTFLKLHGVLK